MDLKRRNLLINAISQLEVAESPMNSNMQKYGAWYGMNGVPWCAIFVSWVYNISQCKLPSVNTPNGFHYCPDMLNYAQKNNLLHDDPKPGDIVLYDWQKDGKPDHTGIFIQWGDKDHKIFFAIEGNTAIGNDSNGGQVMVRQRNVETAFFINILG
jgi:hypothetical protein